MMLKIFSISILLFCFAAGFSQTRKKKTAKIGTVVKKSVEKPAVQSKNIEVYRETERENSVTAIAPEQNSDMPSGFDVYSENGKMGIKNYGTNEILLKPKFRSINKESKDSFQIVSEQGYGIFNTSLNRMVVDTIYGYASTTFFEDENGNVGKNKFLIGIKGKNSDKNGLIDSNYKVILEPEYDYIEKNEDFYRYHKNNLVGVSFFDVSKTNIPMAYENINDLDAARCFVARKQNSVDLYNSRGVLISSNNREINTFYNIWEEKQNPLVMIINSKNKVGFYNAETSKYQIPVIYDNVTDVFDDKYIVKKNSKFGVISSQNETIIPFQYDTLSFYKPNKNNLIILASKSKKWGLINLQNKNITKFIYDEIEEINGFYKAKFEEKYYVLNAGGKQISENGFDGIGEFHNGKAAVFQDNKVGYVNFEGNLVENVLESTAANGYKSLVELYRQFVIALKSKNEDLLIEFSKKICVDSYTQILFERIGFNYRGFPYQMKAKDITIEMVQNSYYKMILQFRDKLIRNNEIESLTFVKLENDRLGYFEQKHQILGTEKRGVLKTNSNTYEYKLGELMYLDGFWKSFTEPH